MSRFIESVSVELPLPKTYRVFSDFERFPALFAELATVRHVGDGHFYWRAKVDDDVLQGEARVTEIRPEERISLVGGAGVDATGVVDFEELDERTTRVTVTIEYELEGLVENVGAAFGVMNDQLRSVLDRLKEVAEATEDPGMAGGGAPMTDEQQKMADAGNWPPKEEPGEFLVGRRKGDPEPFTKLPPGEKGEPPDQT